MDRAATRLYARDPVAAFEKPGHLAVLDDVDSEAVGGARVAPSDGIVARGARARLEETAVDRKASVLRIVEEGQEALDVLALQELGIDAVESHRVALAREHVELDRAVREHDLAALREHHVEVELMREAFPQL